jgi:hypothetical protein
MGHIRFETLPRTCKWIRVLDLIGGGAEAGGAWPLYL